MPVALSGGGGLYIQGGGIRQQGGSIKLRSCESRGSGGGLLISEGDLYQDVGGDISCNDCKAGERGGCLATKDVMSSGSIRAKNCKATKGQRPGSHDFVMSLTMEIKGGGRSWMLHSVFSIHVTSPW